MSAAQIKSEEEHLATKLNLNEFKLPFHQDRDELAIENFDEIAYDLTAQVDFQKIIGLIATTSLATITLLTFFVYLGVQSFMLTQ